MAWLHPLALWLLPLVGVPFLLLWRKPPLERRLVSALHLWRPVVRSASARPAARRLRVDALSLVRATLLLTIVIALAGPVLTSDDGEVALVIDLSPAMAATDGSRTTLDVARQRLLDQVGSLPADTRLHLFAAGTTPVDLGHVTSTGGELQRALKLLQPATGPSDLTEALDLAWAHTPAYGIVVSTRAIPRGLSTSLRWLSVGGHAPNVALEGLALRSSADGNLEAVAALVNDSPSSSTVGLTFATGRESLSSETLSLEPGERRSITRSWQSNATYVQARISADADALPADNARVAARPTERPIRVRIIATGNQFLEAALLAQPQVEVTRVPASDSASVDDEADIVVCDACPTEPLASAIFRVAPPGAAPQPAGAVSVMEPSHPLARDLESLAFLAVTTRVPVGRNDTVILTAGGAPLLTATEVGGRRSASLSAELQSLDLSLSPAFPVLVGNVVDWLSGRAERPVTVEVGRPLRWRVAGSHLRPPYAVERATGEPLPSTTTNGWLVSEPVREPGLYRVRSATGAVDVAFQPAQDTSTAPWTWAPPAGGDLPAREAAGGLLLLALALTALEWRLAPADGTRRWIRVATCAALVLAAADVPLPTGRAGRDVMFVLDQSDSVWVRAQQEAVAVARQMSQQMSRGDRAGVVVFGGSAAVAQPLLEREPDFAASVQVPGGSSNIASALRLARRALPASGERRLVLLSDGRQTDGEARDEAAQAAAAGVRIDVVATGTPERRPALIRSVRAPAEARSGEPFLATVVVDGRPGSTVQVTAGLHDEPAREHPVTLDATGRGQLSLSFRRAETGLYTVLARTGDDGDAGAGAAVHVTGPPRALYVGQESDSPVLRALRTAGVHVEHTTASGAPETTAGLASFDLVVLDDSPAIALGEGRLGALASYVQREGGGLLLLGSARSLEAPAFTDTPLAPLLPLDVRPRPGTRAPSAGYVVVFDKSGSMSDRSDGIPKIELARQAAIRVLGVLPPGDGFGVIGFDAKPTALMPLGQERDAGTLRAALSRVTPSGATAAGPAVSLAGQWLQDAHLDRRHVLLVSDGRTSAADLDLMAQAARDARMELSIIAIGADANREALTRLATSTGGRAYFPEDLRDLPALAARDAVRSRGGVSVEERFTVQAPVAHPVLGGLVRSRLPVLDGYVVGALTPGSTALLQSHLGDPVLALTQAGLGRTAVYTADLQSGWSAGMRNWTDAGTFWVQLVRWLSRPGSDNRLPFSAVEARGGILVSVDTGESPGSLRDGHIRVEVQTPQGITRQVPMVPAGSGSFEGQLAVDSPGTYPVMVSATDAVTGAGFRRQAGVYVSGTMERLGGDPDLALLRSLAALTDGRELSSNESPFDDTRHLGFSRHRAWLAATALMLSLWAMCGLALPPLRRIRSMRTAS